jgi:hypothetical protein
LDAIQGFGRIGIDRPDRCVCVRAPENGGMHTPGRLVIIYVASASCQKTGIFKARLAFPKVAAPPCSNTHATPRFVSHLSDYGFRLSLLRRNCKEFSTK